LHCAASNKTLPAEFSTDIGPRFVEKWTVRMEGRLPAKTSAWRPKAEVFLISISGAVAMQTIIMIKSKHSGA
jgi:hypothetical protein